jgi:hypothetical protein
MDRDADARIGAAAADVGDRGVDVGVARCPVRRQQGCRRHQHAALAIAALRHLVQHPGALQGVRPGGAAERFDRRDALAADRFERRHARADGAAFDEHRAGAAGGDAAAELGSGEAEQFAQGPEQRHLRRGQLIGKGARCAVDHNLHVSPFALTAEDGDCAGAPE